MCIQNESEMHEGSHVKAFNSNLNNERKLERICGKKYVILKNLKNEKLML